MGFALTQNGLASLFISPASGPSGTIATIEFSGLNVKDSIGISMSNGFKAIRGLDSKGNVTIEQAITGKPGEEILIEVTTGEGANEETIAVRFEVTAPYIFK